MTLRTDYEKELARLEAIVAQASQDPNTPCDLGLEPLKATYRRGEAALSRLDAHGVYVVLPDNGNGCGIIDRETNTLIERAGGFYLEDGAELFHNAHHCAQGRYRAMQ